MATSLSQPSSEERAGGGSPSANIFCFEPRPGNGTLPHIAAYRYDGQGRRVEFVRYDPNEVSANDRTFRYYYDGSNVIAEYEYDSSAVLTGTRTYVHGTGYIDERAVMRDHDDWEETGAE